jgi:hypothetical protein
MVKQWPGFITPTALFSEKEKKAKQNSGGIMPGDFSH